MRRGKHTSINNVNILLALILSYDSVEKAIEKEYYCRIIIIIMRLYRPLFLPVTREK